MELKPCPFCGSNSTMEDTEYEGQVYCRTCDAAVVAGNWNTRPIEDELEAERDEARADSAHQAEIIARLGDEVDGLKAKLDRVREWRKSEEPMGFVVYYFNRSGMARLDQAFDALDEILGNLPETPDSSKED